METFALHARVTHGGLTDLVSVRGRALCSLSTADRVTWVVGIAWKERGLSLSASNRCGPLHSRGAVTGSADVGTPSSASATAPNA